jgi:hypothetical protein
METAKSVFRTGTALPDGVVMMTTTATADRARSLRLVGVIFALAILWVDAPAAAQEGAPAETQAEEPAAVEEDTAPEAQAAEVRTSARDRGPHAARPFYLSAGAGASIGLDFGSSAKLKLQQEAGYHFFGFGEHPGLFAGVSFAQSAIDFTILQFGVRLGVDFQLFSNGSLSVLVAPSVASGLGMYVVPSSVIGTEVRSFFNLQFAADIKFVILEGKWALWVRPVGFDFFVNGGSLERYDILVGAQLNL